jgi:hypothetical protein
MCPDGCNAGGAANAVERRKALILVALLSQLQSGLCLVK